MNVLTDSDAKEIHRVLCATVGADYLTIAKAASVATIHKLAAGVSVEPAAWFELNSDMDAWFLSYGFNPKAKTRPLYTATAIAAARVQAIEECAKVCDPNALGLEQGDDGATGVYRVEKAIRALLEKELT